MLFLCTHLMFRHQQALHPAAELLRASLPLEDVPAALARDVAEGSLCACFLRAVVPASSADVTVGESSV